MGNNSIICAKVCRAVRQGVKMSLSSALPWFIIHLPLGWIQFAAVIFKQP